MEKFTQAPVGLDIDQTVSSNSQAIANITTSIKREVLTSATNFNALRVAGDNPNAYYCGSNLGLHSGIPSGSYNNVPFTLDVVSMGSYSVQTLNVYASSGGPRTFRRQTYYSGGETPYNSWSELATREILSNIFTLDTTYIEGHEIFARETAGVVTLNGYVKLKSSAVTGAHSIGSISQGHRPGGNVRIAVGFAAQAYQVPTGMGYLNVATDGDVNVTASSGNSSQCFYFSLSYVAQN